MTNDILGKPMVGFGESLGKLLTDYLLQDLPTLRRRVEWEIRDNYENPDVSYLKLLQIEHHEFVGFEEAVVTATFHCEAEIEADVAEQNCYARRKRGKVKNDTYYGDFLAKVRLRLTPEGVEPVEVLEIDM